MAAGKRGDAGRPLLADALAAGRPPGQHPWPRSRGELIAVPVAASGALLAALFAVARGAAGLGLAAALFAAAAAALVAFGVAARGREKAERRAAVDWVVHFDVYLARAEIAELEVGWLRALADAHKALRAFDAKAGTGGQLREFEAWRPDLAEMVHEVARDTDGAPAGEGAAS
jgi:hypothetical protein